MIFYTMLVLMFLGSTLVFYSLSPYYGALGLVLVALSGCFLCSLLGFSFIALILILMYIGGMLVVFVYSTVISAERYPTISKFNEVILLSVLVMCWGVLKFDSLMKFKGGKWGFVSTNDWAGCSSLYDEVGWYLLMGGYMLLIALMVALVLTYGSDYGILKAL